MKMFKAFLRFHKFPHYDMMKAQQTNGGVFMRRFNKIIVVVCNAQCTYM